MPVPPIPDFLTPTQGLRIVFDRSNVIKPRDVAIALARIAEEKKAEDIVILDIHKLTYITDYFVIATAFNKRQLQAIADDVEKRMKQEGARCLGREGYHEAVWILLDFGEVVIHLFDEEARRTYDLEMLWGDAPRVRWKAAAKKKPELHKTG